MAQGELSFSEFDEPDRRFSRQADFFQGKQPKRSPTQAPATENKAKSARKRVLTVSQLTRLIKLALSEHLPGRIVVRGELSNCKHHHSGHLYLTLKDEATQIAAVMWRSAAGKLAFKPTDGLAVIATGRVDLYEPQGKVQFYVDTLEPAGAGALDLAFRQLAERLRREGLFEEAHKKPPPRFPGTIAIVTSPTGAAIEDIRHTLNRRFPAVRKLLYPVAVQGEGATEEIAGAIGALNQRREALGGIDVMIVGRGGGSLEDLWAFNEEAVARAIYASEIPVISAVGHEVDLTIADLVADLRAPTPTAAAELAVPDRAELIQDLEQYRQRLAQGIYQGWRRAREDLWRVRQRSLWARPLDLLRIPRQRLDERSAVFSQSYSGRVRRAIARLERGERILQRIEPRVALARARERLSDLGHHIRAAIHDEQRRRGDGLTVLTGRLQAATPRHRIHQQYTILSHEGRRLARAAEQLRRERRQHWDGLRKRLENLDPRLVLRRGYSITRLKEDGSIIDGARPPEKGTRLLTELADRLVIESEVTEPTERAQIGIASKK